MNQNFRLRFDQMRESAPTERPETDDHGGDGTRYETAGHVRNLCLGWPDGRRMFLNYAYLVACEYEPGDEKNVIKLSFSSHTVLVKGYCLETLFMDLLDHLPRLIVATEPRYVMAEDKADPIATEINVEPKDA